MTTAIAALIVLMFAAVGYGKGLLPAALDLGAAITSVLAILLLARPLARLLQDTSMASGMLAYVAAPVLIVIATALAFKIIGIPVRRLGRDENDKPRMRAAGAAVNAMAGTVWAAMVVWAVMLFQGLSGTPPAAQPVVEKIAGQAVGTLGSVGAALAFTKEPLAGPAAYQVLRDPGRGARGVQAMMKNEKLKEVLGDPDLQAALQGGQREPVLAHPRFQELFQDPVTAAALGDLGLSTPELEGMVKQRTADMLLQVWARMEALRNDPEAQATLNDPTFKQAAESGDVGALLAHPGLRHLLKTVFAEDPKVPAPPAGAPAP